ncbi:MAG: hypothetical protein QOH43_814 [Solirubrobacteraceae bacterium]|nr:hypothetical protein [Solirubrobacteraceae bacterium]
MSPKRSGSRVALASVAILGVSVATGALLRRRRTAAAPPPPRAAEHEWTCACGQVYRVVGEGRHQVFWLASAGPDEPVLDGACPTCERPLPREATTA